MSTVKELHKKWLKDPGYLQAYEASAEEFEVARALVKARVEANLTQAEVAQRMNTSQGAVARLEGGDGNPSLKTLKKYALATGSRLRVELESSVR